MATAPSYRSRFGDTTLTKVFVGGLAWETPSAELRRYFDQFGDILEAVVITDKNTGRSKGYGFVTFREPESARRACEEPNPVIEGRRANCNIAAFGRPRPSPPRGNPHQQRDPQPAGPPYSRIPSQMVPPPPVIYPPYGYVTYTADYGYPQAVYNPQMPAQYHPQMYGPPSPTMGPPYSYPPISYTMQGPSRANFPIGSQGPRMQGRSPPPLPPYVQYLPAQGGISSSSHPYGFQLQAPPTRQAQQASDSEAQQQQQQPPSKSEPNSEGSPEA